MIFPILPRRLGQAMRDMSYLLTPSQSQSLSHSVSLSLSLIAVANQKAEEVFALRVSNLPPWFSPLTAIPDEDFEVSWKFVTERKYGKELTGAQWIGPELLATDFVVLIKLAQHVHKLFMPRQAGLKTGKPCAQLDSNGLPFAVHHEVLFGRQGGLVRTVSERRSEKVIVVITCLCAGRSIR